jgi:hypothetical protein
MLAAVANMPEEHAAIIIARTNASDRVKLIEAFLIPGQMPNETVAVIEHYLIFGAFRVTLGTCSQHHGVRRVSK